MSFHVIHSLAEDHHSGFTQGQFRKLDQLYCVAAARGSLPHRTVECDFDQGIASYTYYIKDQSAPYLQFVIRRVGVRSTMFELFKAGKGRIEKSGLFERTYERLRQEIDLLDENH